jgi:penicillin-binding protein 1A
MKILSRPGDENYESLATVETDGGPDAAFRSPPSSRRSPWRLLLRSFLRVLRFLRRTLIALLTTVTVIPFLLAAALVTSLATYVFLPLPVTLPEQRPQPEAQASTVYAIDGTPIGQFRGAEQQVSVSPDDIPDTIRRAVVAAEDHRFFEHNGVDYQAIGRALVTDVKARHVVQGGSTITQQLVKSLYTGGERSMGRKAREALLAIRVERTYPKAEILARYLNGVYLGESTFGVEAASQSYFRKRAKDLTLSEAALLAGVIPAPSLFSPRTNPDLAEGRRQLVLDLLARYGMASPQEVAQARAEHPTIHPAPKPESRFPYFMDYVRLYLLNVKGYSPELVYKGGLRIETTLDPRLQAAAEAAVARLDQPKDPEATMVSLEPQTGFVRALVGGRSWEASQVNLALGRLGGGSGRQAGSAFKPFVLARAFEAGIPPEKRYRAPASIQPRGFDKPVSNYGGTGYGSADLRTATWKSINTVFVQLIVDVGIKETAELAKRMGISGIRLDQKLYGVMAIGTQETSALEMASAYGTFANRGLRVAPTPVLSIADAKGKKIEDNREPQGQRVLSEVVADNVTSVLEGVIAKGTGTRANIGRPAAGKTGTSENWENAWFVGYTPTLATAVWMGYPNANIGMANVHGIPHVVGGSLPSMMWHDYMIEAVKEVPPLPFAEAARLPSVAKKEAKALQIENERLKERGGFEFPDVRSPEELPPGGTWWTPVPVPRPKAPPPPKATPPSTAPAPDSPPPTSPGPDPAAPPPPKDKPSSPTTSTTSPPPRSSPVPPVVPFPRQ